jgi:hypothetical protein
MMYRHVCTLFRHVHTVYHILSRDQGGRIPDDMGIQETHIKVENQYYRQCKFYKRVCTQYEHV